MTRTRLCAVAATTGLLLSVLATTTPAEAAAPKPGGLKATGVSTTALAFAWKPVKKAESYEVEVARTASFDKLLLDENTENTVATPTEALPPGRLYWRVRAQVNGKTSKWATSSILQQQRPGPVQLLPAHASTLEQPASPPTLVWQPVAGAEEYLVEIDGAERDWVDTEVIRTDTTSTVVNEPQPNGTYWWRVRALLDRDVLTRPSSERSYTIGALPLVDLDEIQSPMEEVVLSWQPVAGAADYEIRVSTDDGFNNIVYKSFVDGIRYSPPKTYDNASYWWQVRARNSLGQTAEWDAAEVGVFRRAWNVKPELGYPTDGATPTGDLFFQWEPVRLASHYRLFVSTEPGFSNSRTTRSCITEQTTFTPRGLRFPGASQSCYPWEGNGTYYWRVQALDRPTEVQSVFSSVRSFTFQAPTPASPGPLGSVSGQRLSLHGTGTSPCARSLQARTGTCAVSATPMFRWDPTPGAASYLIYLAHDPDMTNMVSGYGNASFPATLPSTDAPLWMPPRSLRDTQAGEAYYWHIRACDHQGLCGLTPEKASNSFEKTSPKVELVAPAANSTVADSVTFRWADYRETNLAVTDPDTREQPHQTGESYRIQVSDTETFAKKIDEIVVDQTTYTAFSKMYPEGQLWWRVQAIDGNGNDLTWSTPRRFTKASPPPLPIGPANGQVVSGIQPFRWLPGSFAKYYDLEVYRNADTTASSSNLAARASNIRQTAFAFDEPLEALGTDFVWRLRKSDASGNKSAWGAWQRFRVGAAVPVLASPASARKVTNARLLFSWRAQPQALSYLIQLRRGSEIEESVSTRATVFAPTDRLDKGKWSWRVTALDAGKDPLRASAWRKFTVKR